MRIVYPHQLDFMDNYIEANRALWNAKTPHHLESEFYDNESFVDGRNALMEIELALLGEVKGKSILHPQCHFGQDSLSLVRMGAEVTGVDLSDEAIKAAQDLSSQTGLAATFHQGNVLEMDQVLKGKTFDMVFTSYGTVGWLHDINLWARQIARHLKPGGTFIFAEFHPVVWMFDDNFTQITYPYLKADTIVEEIEGTYADREAPIKNTSYSWNHGMSEVIQALLDAGLELEVCQEFDYSPYDCFPNTVKSKKGYQIKGMEGLIPMVYALKMKK